MAFRKRKTGKRSHSRSRSRSRRQRGSGGEDEKIKNVENFLQGLITQCRPYVNNPNDPTNGFCTKIYMDAIKHKHDLEKANNK